MSDTPDPMIRFVLMVGLAEAVIVGAILLSVVVLHFVRVLDVQRRKRFHAVWRPLFMQSLVAVPPALPPVSLGDQLSFLYYWNYFHESLLGDDKIHALNRIARLTGMDTAAKRLLKKRGLYKQLMAIVTLGHLKDRSMWEELKDLAASPHPIVSLAAAQALLHIEAREAMSFLAPLIATRADWSPAKVAAMLYHADAEVIATPLVNEIQRTSPAMAARLIHYLEASRSIQALPQVRGLLARPSTAEAVVVAVLHWIAHFPQPEDLDVLRRFLGHESGAVRAQAVMVLGKVGVPADVERLVPLLRDQIWEVRYRAAEALAALPFMTVERLRAIEDQQTDEAARAILQPFVVARRDGIAERGRGMEDGGGRPGSG